MLPSSVHLATRFQRRRLKLEKFRDDRRRTSSDGKSSHCLLQEELKITILTKIWPNKLIYCIYFYILWVIFHKNSLRNKARDKNSLSRKWPRIESSRGPWTCANQTSLMGFTPPTPTKWFHTESLFYFHCVLIYLSYWSCFIHLQVVS